MTQNVHHEVTLEWQNGTVTPTPQPVRADAGDTISFVLWNQPDGQLKVRFDEPNLFSAPEFNHGDPPVQIVKLERETTYACAMNIGGKKFEVAGPQGGSIKPPRG